MGAELELDLLQLIEDRPGKREGDPESALVPTDQVQEQRCGRSVALVCHLFQDLAIGIVVEVEGIGAED